MEVSLARFRDDISERETLCVLEAGKTFVDGGGRLMEVAGHVGGLERGRDFVHLLDPAPGFRGGPDDLRFDRRQREAAVCELSLQLVEDAVVPGGGVERG